MAKHQLLSKPRKTMRIYYGTGKVPLYWTVKVTNAKKAVTIKGSLMDALRGTPGQTIGCHLSHCAINNAGLFPHAVYLASFTKVGCAIVDKIAGGRPVHAVRYAHAYRELVDLNDTDLKKTVVINNPKLVERTFVLRPPDRVTPFVSREERRRRGWVKDKNEDDSRPRSMKVPRGALSRARKAGLVTADLAAALVTR